MVPILSAASACQPLNVEFRGNILFFYTPEYSDSSLGASAWALFTVAYLQVGVLFVACSLSRLFTPRRARSFPTAPVDLSLPCVFSLCFSIHWSFNFIVNESCRHPNALTTMIMATNADATAGGSRCHPLAGGSGPRNLPSEAALSPAKCVCSVSLARY